MAYITERWSVGVTSFPNIRGVVVRTHGCEGHTEDRRTAPKQLSSPKRQHGYAGISARTGLRITLDSSTDS